MALTFAVVGDVVSPRERGRYIGLLAGTWAFASVLGPLVGGFIVDNMSWRWVFLINLPVGALAFAVTSSVLHLPVVRRSHPHRHPGRGAADGERELPAAGAGVGRHGVPVVVAGHQRPAGRRRRNAGRLRILGVARGRTHPAAAPVPRSHLLGQLGARLPDGLRPVRRRDLPAGCFCRWSPGSRPRTPGCCCCRSRQAW